MVSIEEYKSRWNEHINELNGLMWNLSPEKIEELKDIERDLFKLVEIAAKDIGLQRSQRDSADNALKLVKSHQKEG